MEEEKLTNPTEIREKCICTARCDISFGNIQQSWEDNNYIYFLDRVKGYKDKWVLVHTQKKILNGGSIYE